MDSCLCFRDAGPMRVFRCGGCREILGDSASFICRTTQPESLVTVGKATAVVQGGELQTHSSGTLVGSSYYSFWCRGCGVVAGRRYVATPVELDALREGYSFDLSAVGEYVLGTMAVTVLGRDGREVVLSEATAPNPENGQQAPDLTNRMERLEAEITRVKAVVVKLSERVGGPGGSSPSPSGRPPSFPQAVDYPRGGGAGHSQAGPFSPPLAPSHSAGTPRYRPLLPPPTWCQGYATPPRTLPNPKAIASLAKQRPTLSAAGSQCAAAPTPPTAAARVLEEQRRDRGAHPSATNGDHVQLGDGYPPVASRDGAGGGAGRRIQPIPVRREEAPDGKEDQRAAGGGGDGNAPAPAAGGVHKETASRAAKKRRRADSRPCSSDETIGTYTKRITRSQAALPPPPPQ